MSASTPNPDSPVRRMSIAIGVAVGIMLIAGLVYFLVSSKDTNTKFNGAAIVAAASAYSHDLQARKQPIPDSVSLEDLVTQHFLKPEDVETFRGTKATVMLKGDPNNPQTVVMRVHFSDGTDVVLLADGTAQQVRH